MQRNSLLQGRIWLGPLIGVVVGLLLGLFIGWVILPVSWAPGADDIATMADAYDINTNNLAFARSRLSGLSKDEQTRMFTDLIRTRQQANRPIEAKRITTLAQALNLPVTAAGTSPAPAGTAPARTPTTGTSSSAPAGSLSSLLLPLLLLLVVIVLLAAAAVVFVTKVMPQLRASQGTRRTTTTATTTTATSAGPAPMRPAAPAAPTTSAGGLGRFVASYALGNDNYDTSFSLETSKQEFLGECGMGISETVGEGKPDKVTAFDLWLFDKADVRTVTQIVMSEYAYNDQSLRAKLAPKGEAILAEKGKTISLETQSLRIAAQIVELVYATTPGLPSSSHFQKLTIEIVPFLKEAVPA